MVPLEQLDELIIKQQPELADAMVWLQGDRYDRAKLTLYLWREKYAPLIILTGNNRLLGKGDRPGETNIRLDDMKQWLTDREVPPENILVDESSLNTREQAINVLDIAQNRNFKKLIIVSSAPHYHMRAFLTFLKRALEIGWKGKIINQCVVINPSQIPGGRDKTAHILREDETRKIKAYYEHVAAVDDGIRYLKRLT